MTCELVPAIERRYCYVVEVELATEYCDCFTCNCVMGLTESLQFDGSEYVSSFRWRRNDEFYDNLKKRQQAKSEPEETEEYAYYGSSPVSNAYLGQSFTPVGIE
jgi:hypothetical protein